MPAYVAVHQPSPRVVGLESYYEISALASLRIERHDCGVTSRRVVKLERDVVRVGSGSLREDKRVMAVKMDWMRERNRRLDNDVHPLLAVPPANLYGEVAGVAGDSVVPIDASERWIAPLGLKGIAIQAPFEEIRSFWPFANDDVFVNLGRLRACVEGSDRNEFLVRLIHTFIRVLATDRVRGATKAFVVYYALDVPGIAELSARSLVIRAHPVVARLLIRLDENVVPLADVDVEDVGLVRFDRNKVGRNDSELVAINVELEGGLNGGVDDAEHMSFARLESHLETRSRFGCAVVRAPDVHAVDQAGVESLRSESGCVSNCLGEVVSFFHSLVVPVLKDDRAHVDVVICRVWAVNDHGTKHAIVRLQREMGVVP